MGRVISESDGTQGDAGGAGGGMIKGTQGVPDVGIDVISETQGAPVVGGMMSDPMWFSGFIIRVVAIVTTFIATILMGVTEETVDYVRLRATDDSSFQYFIAANAITFIYSAASTALSILKGRENLVKMVLMIGDLVMLAFLFSANGSAAATAVYVRDGDLCDLFGKVCRNIAGAIALSMFAAFGYLALTIIDVIRCRRSSNQSI